jgi:hypothetical protein
MSASVSELKFSNSSKEMGEFHSKAFNVFEEKDMEEYQRIRRSNNDRSTGVRIEHIQQFVKKTTVLTSSDDGDKVATTTEDLFIFVQWWEKKPAQDKGATNEEDREWHQERPA